jgi:two-component system phosphate regulon response regulator OmpR
MGRNRLDLDMRRLFGPDGREVPLVASEFELLRAFAERPGRTLSRETLLDLAHPHGEEHFDRSIDVRITRIRRKIEVEPSHPMVIRTVRGPGLRLRPRRGCLSRAASRRRWSSAPGFPRSWTR